MGNIYYYTNNSGIWTANNGTLLYTNSPPGW